MKLWQGAMAALGGAALAVAAIYAVPGWAPVAGSGAPADAAAVEKPFGVVEADAETLKRADIRVAALTTGSVQSGRAGYARALDLSALASINADYRAAAAAEDASASEYDRQKALFAADISTSARAVEQARVQAVADAEKVTFACRRVALEVGAGLERLGCPALDGLLRDAAAGRATLVRLDFVDGPPPAGTHVLLSSGNIEANVRVIGPAASADPQLQTAGVLAIVRGPAAARFGVGQVLDARIAGSDVTTNGVLVPRSAILRADGALWVYRAMKEGTFQRVELKDAQAAPDGLLVRQGLKPGDGIVVSGAGTLFGLEHAAPAEEE